MPVSFVADRLHWDPVRRVDGRVGRPAVTCGDRSPLVLVLEVGVQLVGDRRDTVSRVERFEQVLFADFARSGLIHYHALHRNHVRFDLWCVRRSRCHSASDRPRSAQPREAQGGPSRLSCLNGRSLNDHRARWASSLRSVALSRPSISAASSRVLRVRPVGYWDPSRPASSFLVAGHGRRRCSLRY